MPEVMLPITGPAYRNVDEQGLESASAIVQDAYVNELDWTEKRPGLTLFVDLGTGAGVDGLYWWDNAGKVVAVSNGQIFTLSNVGIATNVTGDALAVGTPVTFSPGANFRLDMANVGRIVCYYNTGTSIYLADVDAPTQCSHVDFLDQYLLANEIGTGRFHWSDVNAPTVWQTASFATAEGKTDDLVALHVAYREIYLWGRETTEIWFNDGTTPFSRNPNVFIEHGLEAIYSLVPHTTKTSNSWFWLNQDRRLVRMTNRVPEAVSVPFDKILANFSTVADCRAFLLQVNNAPLYVMTFPTAGRTLVYNLLRNDWHEWGYWNPTTAVYDAYRGQVACYARAWNKHLVGDRTNGKIYTASRDIFTDNGATIRTARRTGVYDHGTSVRKRSFQNVIRFKRSVANQSTSDPKVTIRKNKDGKGWEQEQSYSLGQVGQHEPYIKDMGSGIYRTCQLEIVHSDDSDFVMMGGKEIIEVLQS